ncbi:MAG: bifunctional precorrin-2 dehydrogenase/sirohydrochlorin ferrochelatase [bacterium]|nr:bifunctional precorrin-2 dehydrogenase/sirohydrochlorin ferrochelatase [bacterium]
MNELYPIFLKAQSVPILVVGGGNVGAEKLRYLLKSSPNAWVEVVATYFNDEVKELAKKHQVKLIHRTFQVSDLERRSLVIVATDDALLNLGIHAVCRKRQLLVNVADQPELCDFYLGGVVTKGNLKLAISTNGKSPTTAKRLRQLFEEVLPDDIDVLLENLHKYRKTLTMDFEEKVATLNELTEGLLNR